MSDSAGIQESAAGVSGNTAPIQGAAACSIPSAALQSLMVQPLPIALVHQLLKRHHYLHFLSGGTRLSFGVFQGDRLVGVSSLSYRQRFDTSTALGQLLLNLPASLAQFELELIRERVKAGMDRARRQGKPIGQPKEIDRRGFSRRFGEVLERLIKGEISRSQTARELKIGNATLKRRLDGLARHQAEDLT